MGMSDASAVPLRAFLRWEAGEGGELRKAASPRVDTDKCLNCGTCLRACPTGAIGELQRQICRLCPDCAEGKIMFPRDMEALTARSCSLACPLGHYPEGYLNLLARGDWEGAWRVISAVNPLPATLGRICSRPCEEECKRGILIDRALPIRAAKREVAEWAYRSGLARPRVYRRNIDMKVAVAGSGPAGLTAACDLASLGYRVTLFEKAPALGGMLRLAVPSFRLPEEVWRREYELALGEGVETVFGAAVGSSPTLEELRRDGYRAVVLATGAPLGKKLPIPGRDFLGVYDALAFMGAVKQGRPIRVGERVVVIGGGSVATDVARTALRVGAREACLVCIEDECSMPALSWELEEARREGVKVVAAHAPLRVLSRWMQAEGVELAGVSCVRRDELGRMCPELEEGSGMTLPADTVIFAVGQGVDGLTLRRIGLELDGAGMPIIDEESGAASLPGIFAAGDLIGGQGSVVEAMASGRRAALAADAFLQGKTREEKKRMVRGAPLEEKIFPVRLEKLEPLRLPHLTPEEALSSFRQVDLPVEAGALMTDARRCMRCGYIEVNHDLCVGCGTCRDVCPAGDVIVMGPPRLSEEPGGGS